MDITSGAGMRQIFCSKKFAALRLSLCLSLSLSLTACGSGGGSDDDDSGDQIGKACGGIQGDVCGTGFYCFFENNTCGFRNTPGTCQIRPDFCTDQINPVCGCDGRIYQNSCEAAGAGQSLRPIQECL